MCLGAASGGIKFCMLPCNQCNFATHEKKVKVTPNHLYILGEKILGSAIGIGIHFGTSSWRTPPPEMIGNAFFNLYLKR
jgi:hypothetical protein